MTETWKRWQGWITVVLGVLLFITPFIFGATGMAAVAWTAYVGGLLLVIAGLWSLSAPSIHFTEYSEIVIGVLVFVAPFVLGFTGLTYMAWSDWIAGILAVLLGGSVVFSQGGMQQLAGQR